MMHIQERLHDGRPRTGATDTHWIIADAVQEIKP